MIQGTFRKLFFFALIFLSPLAALPADAVTACQNTAQAFARWKSFTEDLQKACRKDLEDRAKEDKDFRIYDREFEDFQKSSFANMILRCADGIRVGGSRAATAIKAIPNSISNALTVAGFFAKESLLTGYELAVGDMKSLLFPAEAAAIAAEANAAAMFHVMNIRRAVLNLAAALARSLADGAGAFDRLQCYPPSFLVETVCRIWSALLVEFSLPKALVGGAELAAEVTQFVKRITPTLKEAGINPGKQPLSKTLDRIAETFEAGAQRGQVQKVHFEWEDSRLVETINSHGQRQYFLEKRSPSGRWIAEKVKIDQTTGLIDGKDATGRELLERIIDSAGSNRRKSIDTTSGQPKKSVLIVSDAVGLGKVNYIGDGLGTGDRYLGRIAEIIKKNVRESTDLPTRYGGDEKVIILSEVTEDKAVEILRKISIEVQKDPELQLLFNSERHKLAGQYRAVNLATNPLEFFYNWRKSGFFLRPEQIEAANNNFQSFKAGFLETQLVAIKEMARLRPGVALGSTAVEVGDTLESLLKRASGQVAEVKGVYQIKLGDPGAAKKYNVSTLGVAHNFSVRAPEVKPPVQRTSASR